MAQQIIVRDAERIVNINHFKYDKTIKTFTIKQKDLIPLIAPLHNEYAIPRRIVINGNTGKREVFNIDILYSESITIPKSMGNTYTIQYYGLEYKINVIVDVQQ